MIILPDCEIKPLSACEAGRLVRLIGHLKDGEFALVADLENSEHRALILFQESAPVYLIEEEPAKVKVLAYSSDLIFEVDHHGPYEPVVQKMYEASGCVIREGTHWLLNVQSPNNQFRLQRAQYDMDNFQLVGVNHEIQNTAIFGKWSLYLGGPETLREDRIRISTFEWTPKQAQGI